MQYTTLWTINGEVLIKVKRSSVHPSDAMMVQGVYSRGAALPFKAGLVGVGRVTDRKKAGVAGWLMNNKRIVFAMPEPKFGAWAEYVTTQPSFCFPLPDHLPSESTVNLLSNGATAVGIAGILKKAKTRGAVVTAAAGDFGRLARHHLRDKGMFVIGVVRSEEQVKKLTDEGERYVLNMSEPDFDKQLTKICSRLNVTAAVESIAGAGSSCTILVDLLFYGGIFWLDYHRHLLPDASNKKALTRTGS